MSEQAPIGEANGSELMSDEEKRARLLVIKLAMAQVQLLAEDIAGQLRELEAAGMDLPAMRSTATILAEVALGWGSSPSPEH